MAVINGQELQATPTHAATRIIVKLRQDARRSPSGQDESAPANLREVAPELRFRGYLAGEERLRIAIGATVFDRYIVAEATDSESANDLARKLQALPEVEEAYVEGGPTPPPVNPSDDPRSGNQGYLNAAPAGIDARWTWSISDGTGIGFVDLERGWTLDHEDLAAANITIISGLNRDYPGHGTAVLGEVLAVDNKRGGVGIAPRVSGRVVSQWRDANTYGTAAAILSAAATMSKGDVLLLEAQTTVGSSTKLPVEVETAVFDAIRYAVDQGMIVVEAGGNGSNDLDTWTDASGRQRLNRNSADFRDSGAIMVGAASSAAPHARLGFSNHGSRIDCFAWGENIDTSGDGGIGTSKNAYTTSFGGTSGASPMIAGAAVLLQSWRRQTTGYVYRPDSLRGRLSSSVTNTPSANPTVDRIGVMPDLRGIIEAQIVADQVSSLPDRFYSFVYILFGIIDDSPGVIWVPGKGPVPVDPHWGGSIARQIAGPKRDLLAALAINEIAERVGDPHARNNLAQAAMEAMRGAIDQIGRGV
jgi:hypothetical protein